MICGEKAENIKLYHFVLLLNDSAHQKTDGEYIFAAVKRLLT